MTDSVDTGEARRTRVRRLLIDPLTADGMRFRKGVAEDVQAKRLAQLADDLGYMTDDNLTALRECLATKGEGAHRNFWPERITVLGFAEVCQPRPLEDLKGLARWFGSAAGSAALKDDRLVAEYRFWLRFKRPPTSDQDRRTIASRAAEWRDRALRIEDRIARLGRAADLEDEAWLQAYNRDHAAALKLVNQARDAVV